MQLGLRANLTPFLLLVAVNALVGATLGQERTVVPLLAKDTFHLAGLTAALTFIVAFGPVKAATNFVAGTLSDRLGRKPVLVAGWLVALPVRLLLVWAPNWWWVVGANMLLGVNQGLTWSTTVIMKIDLVGPARRGVAMGLNEASGYGAPAVTALVTGWLAASYGLRPAPFLFGAAVIALGLGLSALAVQETRGHTEHEASSQVAASGDLHAGLTTREVVVLTPFKDKALSAASQAGMVNNLNEGLAWGAVPLLFASHGLSAARIGARRDLPGALGRRAAADRRAVRPHRPQVADRRRHVGAGRRARAVRGRHDVRCMGARCRAARPRHRDGVPDAPRRDRRCRPSGLAGPIARFSVRCAAPARFSVRCAAPARFSVRCAAPARPSA